MLIGIVSDTHGLMRPEALAALRGVEAIVHAGDVGRPEVLAALAAIAPVHAVRGNVDLGTWAEALPATLDLTLAGIRFHVLHRIADLSIDPGAHGIAAVVYGHSHKPAIERREGVLVLNPGSAGPRRFNLPVTIARARLDASGIAPEIVHLL